MNCFLIGGGGYWGRTLIRSSKNTNINFIGYTDINHKEEIEGVKYFPLEVALNKDSNVEAIFVAVPPAEHYNLTKQCLEANKHVWCEKPLTLNASSATELVNLAEKNKLKLHTDLTFCYSPEINFIKDALKFGTYGSPLVYKSIRSHYGPFVKDVSVLHDLLCHDLSLLLYLFGAPSYVLANASKHVNNVWDDCHATYFYGSKDTDFKCEIETSLISNGKNRQINITTDKGFIETNFNGEVITRLRDGEKEVHKMSKFKTPLQIEMNHFADCIKNNKQTLTSGAFGYEVMRLIEFTEKSALGRREIKID